jgi:tetratricopeptide (TPR) repeat protein
MLLFSQNEKASLPLLNENNLDIPSKIDLYLRLSTELINNNLDSSMLFAEKANQLLDDRSADSTKTNIYIQLGNVYVARGNFPMAMENYLKAKRLLDNTGVGKQENAPTLLKQSELLTKIGIAYFYQKNYAQALMNYEKSLQVLEKISSRFSDIKISGNKLRLFNNIAGVHIHQLEYEKALEYYKTAIETNKEVNNEVVEASLCNNIGICYMEKKDFGLANHYFQKALSIRQKLGDQRGIAQCYNSIGKNHVLNGAFAEAKSYFLKALNLGESIGNKESMLISLESLSSIYDTLGDFRNAFYTFKKFKTVNDSLFNAESINKIAQLEKQYEFDQQQKMFDLELKRRIAEKGKRELLYLIIAVTMFFCLLTALLLIYLQRTKLRNSQLENDKLELEHRHLNLEKAKLKEELEFKNRELTTNVMYLLRKNELITNISGKLVRSKLDFKQENQKVIQEIINELKSSQDSDSWEAFEVHFTQVHTDFYKRLNEQFPNLSANERKLCAFLRLNMSTKDIAAITYQSVNSLTVARSRLRKKLNIEGEDIHMVNFLMQF